MAQVPNRERLNPISLFSFLHLSTISKRFRKLKTMLPIESQVGGINLDLEEKLELVKRNTQEIVTVEELRSLLETEARPRAYWGFECSG